MTRGREPYRMGDPRGFRDGDQFGKRRAMEPTDLDRGNYQNSQRARFQQSQVTSYTSALDRLGGIHREQ